MQFKAIHTIGHRDLPSDFNEYIAHG